MNNKRSFHLHLAKKYWEEHVQPFDVVVDATCGNGHDTLFLSSLAKHVYSLDIQKEAILCTKEKLSALQNVTFLHQCHKDIDQIPFGTAPSLIVYNLGYLPGGDKKITTQTRTTLQSIQKGLSLLKEEGALSITCYPGHNEGAKEEQNILKLLQHLSKDAWIICYHQWINRESSPSLFWVKKLPASLIR